MRRMGLDKAAINCLCTTLEEAVHQVRAGLDDSSSSYRDHQLWLVPIHGIRRGNGAGPGIWAMVSTPLLNVLRHKGYEYEMMMPLSSKFYRFIGFALWMTHMWFKPNLTIILQMRYHNFKVPWAHGKRA
jgi:hypothetical protein